MSSSAEGLIEDEDWGQTVFNNVVRDFIKPEVDKRISEGQLQKGVQISQFQVIMNVGEQNEIRLNEEVKILASVRANKDVKEGDLIKVSDITKIEDLHLTEEDENAGHITGVCIGDTWHFRFNFQRNAGKRRQAISTAKEFLHSAEVALSEDHMRAFHENLFEAVEKAVIATLIFLPDENLLNSKKHGLWHSKINWWRSLGNVDERYVTLFNTLTQHRNKARYSYEDFNIDKKDAEKMFSDATEFIDGLEKSISSKAQ